MSDGSSRDSTAAGGANRRGSLTFLRRFLRLPQVVGGLAMAMTMLATVLALVIVQIEENTQFSLMAATVKAAVEHRMTTYTSMLRGGSGLFAADRDVTAGEFTAYARGLDLDREFPGVLGFGWAERLSAASVARIRKDVRAATGSELRLRGQRPGDPLATAVVFLYPFTRSNLAAVGFDMHSEPVRRNAMDLALETGDAAVSESVRLTYETVLGGQPGILIYFPVYSGSEDPVTPEERFRRLRGFLYAPVRAADFIDSIVREDEVPDARSGIYFEILASAPNGERLLYRSGRPEAGYFLFRSPLTIELPVDIPGSPWKLRAQTLPSFHANGRLLLVPLVLLVGMLLSLRLYHVSLWQESERERAEQAVRRLRLSEEALRSANAAKDEFLAMLGHELRNPLSAVTRAVSVLRSAAPGSSTAANAWRVLDRQIKHQVRLVDELLDVSRVTSGKIRITPVRLDLRGVVEAAVAVMSGAAAEHNHRLEFRVPDEPVMVMGDSMRLEQVINNLLANAIKYTPPGGEIRVELQLSPHAAQEEEPDALLTVTDTGIGIEKEDLSDIFELFSQARVSLDRSLGGLGLGLSLVKHLVELHGGSIRAESPGPGLGSCFEVSLPLAPAGEAPKESTPSARSLPAVSRSNGQPAARPLSVVLVEDHPDLRDTLADLLDIWGCHVHTAPDGARGLEIILAERPDLVFLDIGLPGMTGYEVARAVRQTLKSEEMETPGSATTLVALTGYGQMQDADEAMAAGFDFHLVKPCSEERLHEILVDEAARRGRRTPRS